jgi:hypothetical protein
MIFPVIDGDLSDLLFKNPSPVVVVGLRAKGFAKDDDTGFVVQVNQYNPKQTEFDYEGMEGGLLFPDFA